MRPTSAILFMIIVTIIASIFGFGLPVAIAATAIAAMLILYLYSSMVNPLYATWYTIPKGWHYTVKGFFSFLFPLTRIYNSDKYDLKFTVRIPEKCSYNINVVGGHWNKLCGTAFDSVHNNSLRIAWRPTPDSKRVEYCFYDYMDGERGTYYHFKSDWGSMFEILYEKDKMTVQKDTIANEDWVKSNIIQLKDYEHWDRKYRKILLSFFGGEPRAPHKMNIFVQTKLIKRAK